MQRRVRNALHHSSPSHSKFLLMLVPRGHPTWLRVSAAELRVAKKGGNCIPFKDQTENWPSRWYAGGWHQYHVKGRHRQWARDAQTCKPQAYQLQYGPVQTGRLGVRKVRKAGDFFIPSEPFRTHGSVPNMRCWYCTILVRRSTVDVGEYVVGSKYEYERYVPGYEGS